MFKLKIHEFVYSMNRRKEKHKEQKRLKRFHKMGVKYGSNVTVLGDVDLVFSGRLTIGDNCNINPHVYINARSGITIGDDVLIAPNTLVSESVPSHSLVCGNPMSIYPRENATYAFIINKV